MGYAITRKAERLSASRAPQRALRRRRISWRSNSAATLPDRCDFPRLGNVTHLGRSVTVAQQVALWWRSPECTRLGCTRTERLENDHRDDWVKTKHTRLDESDPLCGHDHDLKTYRGWALVTGNGKRPMVPPHDPRHPNYRTPPDG